MVMSNRCKAPNSL